MGILKGDVKERHIVNVTAKKTNQFEAIIQEVLSKVVSDNLTKDPNVESPPTTTATPKLLLLLLLLLLLVLLLLLLVVLVRLLLLL